MPRRRQPEPKRSVSSERVRGTLATFFVWQSDLDQCVREVRATNFTAKALTASEQEDGVRVVSDGFVFGLVAQNEKGVRLVRQNEGLWLVREHVPGQLAAYDSCWVVDPAKIEPEDLPLDWWTSPGFWYGGCSSD